MGLSPEDNEAISEPDSGGAMVGHIQRYKKYISDLKRGGASGISAAFGRASDILPPEAMQIAPPVTTIASSAATENKHRLDEQVFSETYDAQSLRDSVEALVSTCARDLTTAVGEQLDTPFGELTVDEVFIEGERRMFLLSDMRVIAEEQYLRWRRTPADIDKSSVDKSQLARDATGRAPDLTVTNAVGALLWNVYFDGYEPTRVDMFDGTTIARAEGRDELILALNSNGEGVKFFVLSGMMVDPTTGNVFIESNEGAYTAGFLNNGWRIHQYRTRDRGQVYYVSEPVVAGQKPLTIEVANLMLDIETGTVSYETTDNAATVTLRTRKL